MSLGRANRYIPNDKDEAFTQLWQLVERHENSIRSMSELLDATATTNQIIGMIKPLAREAVTYELPIKYDSDKYSVGLKGFNSGGSGISHSALGYLDADDHKQYLLIDGSRAMTGPLYLQGVTAGKFEFEVTGNGTSSSDLALIDVYATTTRMFLSRTGNVGIGTIDPQDKLEVAGASGAYLRLTMTATGLASNIGGMTFSVDTTPVGLVECELTDDDPLESVLKFYTYDTNLYERMRIDKSGNVGIGNQAPTHLLYVGNGSQAEAVVVTDSLATAWSGYGILKEGVSKWYVGMGGSVAYGNKLLFRYDNADKMTLDSDGNLGIGVVSPATKLDLAGTLGLTPGNAQAYIRRTHVDGSYGLVLTGATSDAINDTNPGAYVTIGGGTLTDGYEGSIFLTAYGGSTTDVNRNVIVFSRRTGVNTVTESMRVNGNGSLGIGTVAPDSKLHIFGASAGTVAAVADSIVTIENSGHAYLSFLTPRTAGLVPAEAGVIFGCAAGASEVDNTAGWIKYIQTHQDLTDLSSDTLQIHLSSENSGASGLTCDFNIEPNLYYGVTGGLSINQPFGITVGVTENDPAPEFFIRTNSYFSAGGFLGYLTFYGRYDSDDTEKRYAEIAARVLNVGSDSVGQLSFATTLAGDGAPTAHLYIKNGINYFPKTIKADAESLELDWDATGCGITSNYLRVPKGAETYGMKIAKAANALAILNTTDDSAFTDCAGITHLGGYYVVMTAAENLYEGEVVYQSQSGGANSATKAPTSAAGDMPIGIVYKDATSGNAVKIITTGKAMVLPESGLSLTQGYVIFVSNAEAGRVEQNNVAPVSEHWRECGHSLASSSGNGVLTLAIVHFN